MSCPRGLVPSYVYISLGISPPSFSRLVPVDEGANPSISLCVYRRQIWCHLKLNSPEVINRLEERLMESACHFSSSLLFSSTKLPMRVELSLFKENVFRMRLFFWISVHPREREREGENRSSSQSMKECARSSRSLSQWWRPSNRIGHAERQEIA